jgi:hypothetical protein
MNRLTLFAVLVLAFSLLTGCSDQAVEKLSGPVTSTPSVQTGGNMALSGDAGGVTTLTLSSASAFGGEFKSIIEEALAKGYDGISIERTPGKEDVITYWRFEDAVKWDGVSPLKSRVHYRFDSVEDMQKALIISGKPEIAADLEVLKK